MNDRIDLSIIVPVYNTEIKKLYRCLQSISKIKNLKIECLLVDDGSTNNIGRFCNSYCQSHTDFKYFYQENEGVSSARNTGIRNSKGNYIFFVDSDDMIHEKVFNTWILEGNYDLIFTDMVCVHNHRKAVWKTWDKKELNYDNLIERLVNDGRLNSPFAKYIKREFLLEHKIFFDEHLVSGEDVIFLINILENDPSMFYKEEISYYYFYEIITGINRLKRFPLLCLENESIMYQKFVRCIKKGNFKNEHKEQLFLIEKQRLIHQMFNLVADAQILGVLSVELKKRVREILILFKDTDIQKMNLKSNIRYWLLKENGWGFIKYFGYLRRIYLKIR